MQIFASNPVLSNYKHNHKINDKRDITVSLSSSDVEINPGSRSKSVTYVKTINDDHVSGEFTVENLNPEVQKQLELKDINSNFKKLYIFSPLSNVPDDIDDLFDFVNKQGEASSNPNEVNNRGDESLEEQHSSENKKTVTQKLSQDNLSYLDSKEFYNSEKSDSHDHSEDKLYGDVEIINNQSTLLKMKSQNISQQSQKSDTEFTNDFSLNTSNSPYDKYISNESNERLRNNPKPQSPSATHDAPVTKEYSQFQKDSKEGKISNEQMIRKQ